MNTIVLDLGKVTRITVDDGEAVTENAIDMRDPTHVETFVAWYKAFVMPSDRVYYVINQHPLKGKNAHVTPELVDALTKLNPQAVGVKVNDTKKLIGGHGQTGKSFMQAFVERKLKRTLRHEDYTYALAVLFYVKERGL